MARTLIKPAGASPRRSLGFLAWWWIETFVVNGPGDVRGTPVRRGDEFGGFIVDCYALDEHGDRLVDSAFFSRPKGCDKSGLGAHLALFEAFGPCRFAGWASGGECYEFLGQRYYYEPGEPMGRRVVDPMIRIMATEEGQTGNTYDNIYVNLTEGPLSALAAEGMDVGLTRVKLPDGGDIVPTSSGAASKDGGKETFVVFDETHLYNLPRLRDMYATVKRNLKKRAKGAGTWYLETTTMYAPGEDSIAEQTYNLARNIQDGKFRGRQRLLYDHRGSQLSDLSDINALKEAIIESYGEAMEWNSVEAIIDDIYDPRSTVNDSRRYFLNALVEGSNAWLRLDTLEKATKDLPEKWGDLVKDGEEITLGFDGSLTNDATALVACRVSDGLLFPLRIEERPDGPEARDWRVDEKKFDAAVRLAFQRFTVVGFFADPPYWMDWLDKWERDFGEELRVAAGAGSKIAFYTSHDTKMHFALQRLKTALDTGRAKILPNRRLVRHFQNAQKWTRSRNMEVIGKESQKSPRKIDAAVAATLAFEARATFVKKGDVEKPKQTFVPRRIY
ncbi:terminase large subunit [Rothia nasimurium]|uniref:terminase large subunit n=1 Tax=Rothia nasimurium TaxID=85336 RepID=UPI001F3BF6A0|nr:terminase large subunit [Rothia nasimurium]